MHAFLTFLFASFRDWLNTVRDYIDDWLGGGGGTPTTPPGETITVTNQDGLFSGGEGDDTITATRDIAGAVYSRDHSEFYEETDNFELGGTWATLNWRWDPTDTPYPGTGVLAGLTALQGGAGNDSISATGRAIDIDGGTGNDTISAHNDASGGTWSQPSHIYARGGEGDDNITATGAAVVVRGDAGNDTITINGRGMNVSGGAGNDSLTLSGRDMSVIASAGADVIDATNLTNSWIQLDAEDRLILGTGSVWLRFHLGEGANFTGNAIRNDVLTQGGGTVDGGGGDDFLQLQEGNDLSSTLLGGDGNDTVLGNYTDKFPWAHELFRYAMHVGSTNDVLNGGAGSDYIIFDLADTVTGGAGNDRLVGYAGIGQTSRVNDFDRGEDRLQINLDPATCTAADGSFSTGDITWAWDGQTITFRVDGQEVMVIETDEYLKIGFQIEEGNGPHDPYSPTPTHYVDLNGNGVNPSTCDVIINRFEGDFS